MNYFHLKIAEVEKELDTDIEKGLNTEKINNKREKYGFNEIEGKKKESLFVKFLNQFKDFMIIVLMQ